MPASLPALETLSPPWEAEVLRRGPGGLWYYRIKEKGLLQNETAYFRTGDLGTEGTKISVDEWRNSHQEESPPDIVGFADGSFSLPALPEGFVYSGVALLGKVLVASWEEQLDASIGAAGFMLMALADY